MKSLTTLGVLLLLPLLSACQDAATPRQGPPPGKPAVGYVTLQPSPVLRTIELPGRVAASATAEIRPQVDGIVKRVAFHEGGRLAVGDVLYELDDAKFKAAHAAAAASLKKTEAAAAAAQATFDRNQALVASRTVSVQTLDDARSSLLQAKAEVEAAKAALDTAQINLDYATIRAPIAGIVGASAVSVGALVTQNQTNALATIRQLDPAYVNLVDTSANMLRIRAEVEAGRLGRAKNEPSPIALTLETGSTYKETGEISLAEAVVSESTGTFTLRATFANPDFVLIPGMFVRATVDLGALPGAFLVPQRAVTRGADGKATLYVVSSEGKAELRRVRTEGTKGNDWIVTEGLAAGDKLIVDGFQKISDGSPVSPVEALINGDGVVLQDMKAAKAGDRP
jgi:membrane fusion protein, multidrug efflux system